MMIITHHPHQVHHQALGEAALLDVAGLLPVAVVRPSIVLAAWREPM